MKIRVNGTTLYYEVRGQGPPLLLIHGNGESHAIFNKTVPLLEGRFRVYTPDSRCHGQSQDTEEISYDLMAEDLTEFIHALGLQKPVFYGFSDGGILGLLIAMKEPELLGKLIISGANLDPRGLKFPVRTQIRLAAALRKDKLYRLMAREPAIDPEDLAKIRIPTLVLAGAHDVIRPAHTRLIADSIPGASLRILPGEGHGSYIINSEKLGRILLHSL